MSSIGAEGLGAKAEADGGPGGVAQKVQGPYHTPGGVDPQVAAGGWL